MFAFSRRDWLCLTTAAFAGASMSGWFPALAAQAAATGVRRRSCILLWMSGGPSQMDTFDLKPGHANGGPFKAIDTSVAGMQISEHLPQLAKWMDQCAIIRSLSTSEGDHGRATYLMRTGYRPQGPIQYPGLGSLLSKELARDDLELPNYISIAPYYFLAPTAYGPGFLGPRHAPMIVGNIRPGNQPASGDPYGPSLRVENLDRPAEVQPAQAEARLELLAGLDQDFRAERPGVPTGSHKSAYDSAIRMMRSNAAKAFDLDDEQAALRERYGKNQFGQGCLLARRLIERGVPFVEVSLNGQGEQPIFGWDTHLNNFAIVKGLSGVLDPAWSTLMEDLESRGLLETTTIIWMGEFGRTPKIGDNAGRDHFPAAWSTVLAGGGIKGGRVIGKTSPDGMKVDDRPVSVGDYMATIVRALGLDPMKQNMSNLGRPIRLADPKAKPISEIIA
ncbi:MAG: DUF1501 domain-containing protein [Planctomycetaceae bacterium]